MGIQGLLPQLKSIMQPIHVKDLRGCRVAVDTYSWLHKGALSCSKDLCKGTPTSRHIDYCMHRVNLLRHHGVEPVLVFDGGHLPMKNEEEIKRARARKENFERAIEHESTGNSAAAYECYQKAVDISPSVAYELIQVLKQENVDYIVAPYEADAQMTFLALTKHVDLIITEDSDLIPFGCPRILFKMDKFGQGVQFQYSMLHQNKGLNFTGFTKQMLLEMCILSGCDYLQSLPGMGVKRAHALLRKFKSYDKVIKHLRYNTVAVPPLYEESFKKALWAFQHQRVYDPATQDIIHLTDIPYDLGHDLDFLGPSMPQNLVKGIAKGDINPITKLPFQEVVPSGPGVDRTYLLKDFKSDRERKQLELPAQKNLLTNYFCSASLEAKRKFKAPRITLKPLNHMERSSPICEAPDYEEPITSMFSEATVVDSGLLAKNSPKDSMEDNCATDPTFESPDGNLRSSEHAVRLELSKHAVYKPCPTLHKERESKFLQDGVGEKMRSVNKKVIVRSSYFKPKLLIENDVENKDEILLSRRDSASGLLCEDTARSASFEIDSLKSSIKKRKSIPVQRTESDNMDVKHSLEDTSLSSESNHHADSRPLGMGTEEGKFGCNISHLNYYSDVAEKSMEKFVSVISSFRCTTAGSRASGLRAPLKDMRNTFGMRSTVAPTDLSKFAYRASNKKTASASLRN